MKLSTYLMVKCEKCEQLVPYGQYCFSCGSILPHVHANLAQVKCKICNSNVPNGAYCNKCGGKQD